MGINHHPSAQLLVEGNDDMHVMLALFNQFGIPVNTREQKNGEFSIRPCEGHTGVMEQASVQLKNLKTVGLVLDADVDLVGRWQSVSGLLQKNGFKIPESLPTTGLIVSNARTRAGVWIMPDNQMKGMLEDFVQMLIPVQDALLPLAESVLDDIENSGLKRYENRAKALIHTWLAWQAKPGTPMGQAITAKYLQTNGAIAIHFAEWIKKLFLS